MQHQMRRLILLTAIAMALVLAGCARQELVVPEPDPAAGDYVAVQMNAYLWGQLQYPSPGVAQCRSGALDGVRVVTSYSQALATVLTVGLWMPVTVEYRCRKNPPQPGSTDR